MRGVSGKGRNWPIEGGGAGSWLFGIYRWTRFYSYVRTFTPVTPSGVRVVLYVYMSIHIYIINIYIHTCIYTYMRVYTSSYVCVMLRHIHICGGRKRVSHACVRALATRASSAPRRRRFARKLILRETQRGVPAAAEPAVQPPERSRARRIAHISIRILFA